MSYGEKKLVILNLQELKGKFNRVECVIWTWIESLLKEFEEEFATVELHFTSMYTTNYIKLSSTSIKYTQIGGSSLVLIPKRGWAN